MQDRVLGSSKDKQLNQFFKALAFEFLLISGCAWGVFCIGVSDVASVGVGMNVGISISICINISVDIGDRNNIFGCNCRPGCIARGNRT